VDLQSVNKPEAGVPTKMINSCFVDVNGKWPVYKSAPICIVYQQFHNNPTIALPFDTDFGLKLIHLKDSGL
jgi:hypothetical protein